jgi:hypothetical protein
MRLSLKRTFINAAAVSTSAYFANAFTAPACFDAGF